MAKNRFNHKHKKIRKNISALIVAFLLIGSMFLFPLFNSSFMGETLSNSKGNMANLIIEIVKNINSFFSNSYGFMSVLLALLFVICLLFYLLNGLGLIYNRYSRYASYLTFVYAIVGLIVYNILVNQNTISLFGFELASISYGAGIYFVPILGLLYILFGRRINQRIF
jgi:hypothetical protein